MADTIIQVVEQVVELVVTDEPETTLLATEQVVEFVEAQAPGPAGPDRELLTKIAATPLSGQRVVATQGADQVCYANDADLSLAHGVLGVTTAAASQGAAVPVRRYGEMAHDGWNWTPNAPIYLSGNGFLSQSEPVGAAFLLQIGWAMSPTVISIRIGIPVLV